MKLFYAPQSPFARKVRATAIELDLDDQIELEYVEVVPGAPNRAFADGVNPLRKIPALKTENDEIIYDSTVICEYLIDLAGDDRLIPRNRSRRWRVLSNHALAQGMCDAAIAIRYETWLRPEPKRWPTWVEDQWDKIFCGLAWFDKNTTELKEPIDISHLTLGCLLGYVDFRWPANEWRTRSPSVRDWFVGLGARPSFVRTKPAPPESAPQ